jgi:hypothetical protein
MHNIVQAAADSKLLFSSLFTINENWRYVASVNNETFHC